MFTAIAGVLPPSAMAVSTAAKYAANWVYLEHRQTFYCGCRFNAQKQPDSHHCSQPYNAGETLNKPVQWDYVIPPRLFAAHLSCWRNPRQHRQCRTPDGEFMDPAQCCRTVDATYRDMESDAVNIVPVMDAIRLQLNGYQPGVARRQNAGTGQCRIRRDQGEKTFEPGNHVKGDIARIYQYMNKTYAVPLSQAQRALFTQWSHDDPPGPWETRRNRRIQKIQKKVNPLLPRENHEHAHGHDHQHRHKSNIPPVVRRQYKALIAAVQADHGSLAQQLRQGDDDALKALLPWALQRLKPQYHNGQFSTEGSALIENLAGYFAWICAKHHKSIAWHVEHDNTVHVHIPNSETDMDPVFIVERTVKRVLNGDDDDRALYRAYSNWLKYVGIVKSDMAKAQKAFNRILQPFLTRLEAIGQHAFAVYQPDVVHAVNEAVLFSFVLPTGRYSMSQAFLSMDNGADKALKTALATFFDDANAIAQRYRLSPREKILLFRNSPARSENYGNDYKTFVGTFNLTILKDYYAGWLY